MDAGVSRLPVQTVDHARLLQVRDEVVDVGRLDLGDRPIPEPLDQRLQPVVDGAGQRESLREHVPLLVDLGELAERHRRVVRRRIEPSLVEGAIPDCCGQFVECFVGFRLRT